MRDVPWKRKCSKTHKWSCRVYLREPMPLTPNGSKGLLRRMNNPNASNSLVGGTDQGCPILRKVQRLYFFSKFPFHGTCSIRPFGSIESIGCVRKTTMIRLQSQWHRSMLALAFEEGSWEDFPFQGPMTMLKTSHTS